MAGKETFSSPALTLERFLEGQCLLVPSEQLNEHHNSIPSVKQLVVQASVFQNQVCRNDHSGTRQHCIILLLLKGILSPMPLFALVIKGCNLDAAV